MIQTLVRAAGDSLRSLVLGLVWAAALGGFGLLCVAGAKAAVRYHHHRVDQPRLSHVSCRWHDGRVVVSGVVENPNSGAHRVLVHPHYRLADGVLHAITIDVVDASISEHESVAWRFEGSPLPREPIRSCAPVAWIDDED